MEKEIKTKLNQKRLKWGKKARKIWGVNRRTHKFCQKNTFEISFKFFFAHFLTDKIF